MMKLADELKQHIPEGPPLFANDVMSDKPQRFFAAEIIREQIFGCFSQEVGGWVDVSPPPMFSGGRMAE